MFTDKVMTQRERFINTMEYNPVDRVPNHEVGVWGQTIDRWEKEGLNIYDLHWDWFTGEEFFDMDAREYIDVNYGMLPPFQTKIIEKTDRYEIIRHANGIVSKALVEGTAHGTRASMDQYLKFPVENIHDFRELKKRYVADMHRRYPPQWEKIMLPRWKNREHVLVLGRNCSILGFYWRAREWMGTENLCYAWYDQPELMHEMMEFIADFTIEVSQPILGKTNVDYIFINEDMSMKNGPLLSPKTYREFIYPHMRRLVDYFKSRNVTYVGVDTDGNCEALIPLLMDAGVDFIWPLERAADMDPIKLRRKFGKSLRLWGGVDKRILARTKADIEEHLMTLLPLIEEGGFIPTVDHVVPPDVSARNFIYYMKRKTDLLSGKF
jgi:uroporphyrinogen-III decarboxylase